MKKEIAYRKELLQRLYDGGKLTKDEREWLQTHVAYSQVFGYPFISRDIIVLEPKKMYDVCITLYSYIGSVPMSPALAVPLNRGYINTESEVVDRKGNVQTGRKLKSLATANTLDHPVCNLKITSDAGLISVYYECESEDYRGVKYMTDSTLSNMLAMKKTVISNNKYMYACKDFSDENFDKFIFTVEWKIHDMQR